MALTSARPAVAKNQRGHSVQQWQPDATSALHTGFTAIGMHDAILVGPEDVVEDLPAAGARKLLHGCHRLTCDSTSRHSSSASPPLKATLERPVERHHVVPAACVRIKALGEGCNVSI